MPVSWSAAAVALIVFVALLVLLPQVADQGQALAVFDSFYRAGALVFGGGHVVLPLLQAEVVQSRWVMPDQFLAGYGAAQAVPGPLFTLPPISAQCLDPNPTESQGRQSRLLWSFYRAF